MTELFEKTVEALRTLRIDANRLCDRQLGGTYEEDCRRAIAAADAVLSEVHRRTQDDQSWAGIRLDMIGGTDVKSATRIFGEVENCVVLLKARGAEALDVKILEVGYLGDDAAGEDLWGFRCLPTDDSGEVIAGAPEMAIRFEDVESIGVY